MLTEEEIRDIARVEVDNRMDDIAERAAKKVEMDDIAERAAKKVLDHFYKEVGKGVLRKAAWIAGAAILSVLGWLAGKGYLPSP